MAARSMMPRQLPPRQTIWQFMNEFGTAAWRWISRVYMIAGAMIFAATLLGIHVPEWIATFHELRVQVLYSSFETNNLLPLSPLYLKVLAQTIIYYGTGIALGLAFIEALDNTTPAEQTEQ